MTDDASALLDTIDPSKGATSFEGAAAPRAPQASAQDQADSMLDSIDPRVSGWGAPKGTEPENGSSTVGAFSRAAERSALPTAGGLAGAAGGASAGAEIGALGGPVGAIAGGLIGGIGGSMLGAGAVDAAQNWALSKLPTGAQKFLGGTEDQQREDFEGHPFASILGGVAPYLLTANPGIAARETAEGATGLAKIMGNKYTAAALSGLTMGGITLGQEVVQGEKPNWTEVGINTLLGTVWSKPNALGERIMGGAEAAGARIGQKISRRAPTPENVTIADGGDQKVGPGPGLTEDVATGQAEMAPPAEAQARAAARDEQTLTEPPKAANPVELARATHPEAFEDYEALEHRRETFRAMIDDADEMGDLDASRAAQEHLSNVEKEMDGIAPEIKSAIARVAESRGIETAEPSTDPAHVADLATDGMKQFISDDVSRQLHAAGRSEEEARAAGDLIAARYATRASVMNGAIGTAEDLYRRDGAVIRGGDGTARRVSPAVDKTAENSDLVASEAAQPNPTIEAIRQPEPPGADEIGAAQDRAQKLGLTNLIRQMHGQDVPPEQIADFIGNKMSADQIGAFLSSPEPARIRRARAKGASETIVARRANAPPQTLRAFLKAKGGIRDMFGELRTMGMIKEYPGLVNNKAGHPLDYARTLAAEAGYLGHDTSVADFLDAIKKHPLYTREGQAWLDRQVERNGNEGEDSREAHANERIESFWAEHGEGKIDAELKDRASQILTQRDVTPDEAIEIASIELYHEDGEREHAAGIQADLQGNKGSLEPGERPGEAGTPVGPQEAVRDGSEGFEDVEFFQRRARRRAELEQALKYARATKHGGDPGPEGTEQTLIPGVERVSLKDALENIADKPLTGGNKPLQEEGLFGDEDLRKQGELFQAKSLSEIEELASARGVALDASEKGSTVSLSRIVVPKELREQGIGTEVMKTLVAYADATGKRIELTPSGDFGGTVSRLKKFYKSLGFIENKGRNKDFGTRETMIREPQGRGLDQSVKGKIRFTTGELRPTITLMREGDASTFIHETGHDFLEQMKRDASHEAAPQALKDDIAAVRQWVGNKGGEFKTREHEKFARGFEQYMREGTAPTAGLARVFQQFKSWLTQIYRSIKGLGDPISPEIRRVFDRMLTEPERPAIVAPGRQPGTSIADVHEADALSTPPEHAHAAADRIVAEKEQAKAELPPEIQAEHATGQAEIEAERARAAGIEPAAEDGDGAAGGGNVPDAGGAAGNEPSSGGGGPQSGAKQSSGGGSLSEGNGAGAGSKPAGTGVGDSLLPRPVTRFPEPESNLVDKAGNVRLDNLVLPEQLGEVLMESADRNADFKSVRGSMTKGEMMDLASDLGMRPDEEGLDANLAKITGKFDNLAKYALALRLLVRQSSQAVYEAATISAREGTDEATASLAKAIARHDMIQSTLSGATANWGRSGSAFHNLNSFKGATDLDRVLRENVGRTLFQVRLIGRMIAGADATPAQVSAIVRDSGKYSFGEMILEYWVNGLISGIPTHVTYSVGNSIIAASKIFLETPTAAALGALRGREGSNVIPFGEAAAQLRGAAKGVVPAIHAASEALRTGITTALPGEKTVQTYGPIQAAGLPGAMGARLQENAGLTDVMQSFYGLGRGLKDAFIVSGAIDKAKTPAIGFEYSPRGVIPNVVLGGRARLPVGEAARLPGRFISAIHSFFRAMGYSAEINGQEYRQAYNEGARGDALPQRIADLRLDRQASVMQGATEGEAFDRMAVARFEANEQTLMGPAGKFTQMLSRFTNTAVKLPLLGETRILKFIDPFVNISGQIMNQALLKRTPLGFLAPTIRADLMGTNGPVAADRALARMLVGSSLAVTAGVLAAEGYLSGAGPQDPKLMATWRLAGNQPHSVKLNDTWIDLHRIGPLGMLLGMAADLYDVAHTASHGDMQTAAGQLMHAIAQNVMDESFMRGPAELLKAIDDKSYAENQYIPNFVSSFVPYSVGMGYQARAMDPYMRLTHGTLDAIKAKIPGMSQELQPRRDLWGQPIPNREALGASGLTAIWEQKQSTDPVNIEMQRLGIGKPLPARSLSNIKLSDQQYDDFSRIAGVMTKQRMDQYVRSGLYQHQTDGDRREGIDKIFSACREASRNLMFMKYPSIPATAAALRISRRQGADIRAIGE